MLSRDYSSRIEINVSTMNIVKRLLNVLVISAVGLSASGVVYGISGLYNQLEARRVDCERVKGLEAVKEKIKSGQREPIADIASVTEGMRKLCAREIDVEVLYEEGSDLIQAALTLAVIAVVLNYILLGKVTLWNRVESSPKEQ